MPPCQLVSVIDASRRMDGSGALEAARYERLDRDPTAMPRKERQPEWPCAVCSSRNWMTSASCRDCEKRRTPSDVVITGTGPAFPPQPRVCWTNCSTDRSPRSRAGRGKADWNQAQFGTCETPTRDDAGSMEEATEKYQEAMKELTEARS